MSKELDIDRMRRPNGIVDSVGPLRPQAHPTLLLIAAGNAGFPWLDTKPSCMRR
jgi:hypothetical protein